MSRRRALAPSMRMFIRAGLGIAVCGGGGSGEAFVAHGAGEQRGLIHDISRQFVAPGLEFGDFVVDVVSLEGLVAV